MANRAFAGSTVNYRFLHLDELPNVFHGVVVGKSIATERHELLTPVQTRRPLFIFVINLSVFDQVGIRVQ